MGKSRRKVVTVKPVNTEADWDEMCARKVRHMELEIVIRIQSTRMKYISAKFEWTWNSHGPCLLCQTNQTKSLQDHFNRQKRDFGCAFKHHHLPNNYTKVHKSDCFRQGTFLVVMMSKNGSSLFLTQEGLTVVDVYTEWSGPCTAMQATLKRAKLEVAILWCRCCGFWWGSNRRAAIMMASW